MQIPIIIHTKLCGHAVTISLNTALHIRGVGRCFHKGRLHCALGTEVVLFHTAKTPDAYKRQMRTHIHVRISLL